MKKKTYIALPYLLFLILFVVIPFFVILFYALTDATGNFTFDNFINFFTNPKTMGTLVYSLLISLVSTVICLILAYPTAFMLAKGPLSKGGVYLLLLVIPMWINFTLRITAIKEILTLIQGNIAYYPFFNTIVCMVYDFLPFMILPIYNCLLEIDDEYGEAAMDLGAGRAATFFKVLLPFSLPGIVSGITMVFLPTMTDYVILDMVYNSTFIMGSLIGSYFSSYDWNNGSMISVVLLSIIMLLNVMADWMLKEGGEKK